MLRKIFLLLITVVLLSTIFSFRFFISIANAKCVAHEVTKGDTLVSLTKLYFNSSRYGTLLKNSDLKSLKLKVGDIINIYIPDEDDWQIACNKILMTRIKQRHKEQNLDNVIPAFVDGIERAAEHITMTPKDKLDMCKYAAATSEYESGFRFAVGRAGEIGMFQFMLNTVRDVLKLNKIVKDTSDKSLVIYLLDEENAAFIFALHFQYILVKKHWSLFKAWRNYNGCDTGTMSYNYATGIMERYNEINKINPNMCGGK